MPTGVEGLSDAMRAQLAAQEAGLIAGYNRGDSSRDLATTFRVTESTIKLRLSRLQEAGLIARQRERQTDLSLRRLHSGAEPAGNDGGSGLGSAARNAWPGGPRQMPCLACERPFISSGTDDRQCPSCGSRPESPFAPRAGSGRRCLAKR